MRLLASSMASSCRWTAVSRHIPAYKLKIELHKKPLEKNSTAFCVVYHFFARNAMVEER